MGFWKSKMKLKQYHEFLGLATKSFLQLKFEASKILRVNMLAHRILSYLITVFPD